MADTYTHIVRSGLWGANPALVRLVGLCPLLAISHQVVNAAGIAAVVLLVMCWTSLIVSATRYLLAPEVRPTAYAIVVATGVTVAHLGMQAWFYELAGTLGIYVPVIAGCCLVMSRAEEFACRNAVLPSLADAAANALGIALVLVLLAGLRELIAYGTLFRESFLLFPGAPLSEGWTVLHHYGGLPIAAQPAGALIGLGGLIALRNSLAARWLRGKRPHESGKADGDLRATAPG